MPTPYSRVSALEPGLKEDSMTESRTDGLREVTGSDAATYSDATVQRVITALEKSFHVAEGKFEISEADLAYDSGLLPDCNDFNVGHPYMTYRLPPAPGQTTLNLTSTANIYPEDLGTWLTYRLRQDEAILFIGKTPPKVDYFSYRSYLFWRFYQGESQFRKVFDSLGDTINNMCVKVNDSNGNVYDQPVVIITAANQHILNQVVRVLVEIGIDENIINADRIPLEMVIMGLDNFCDQFFFLNRFGNFASEEARDKYTKNEDGSSGRVWRLTPTEKETPVKPISGAAFLKPRGTGNSSEVELMPALAKLRLGILEKHTHLSATEPQTHMWLFEGYDAIQRGVDAYGEDRDTTYLYSGPFTLRNVQNEFAIIYGVNHAMTKKATYCNFGVYGTKALNGVCSMSSAASDFAGGAEQYLDDPELAKMFYVWKIGRFPSDEERYLQVPYQPKYDEEGFILNGSVIPLEQEAFVGFRAYLEPATGVGPAWWEILYDRVIKFSPYV